MNRPRLGRRLRTVLSLVPRDAQGVADLGAGHGALSAHLVLHGFTRVIATESQPGPLTELRHNLAAWELDDWVEVRSGDGMSVLAAGDADAVVVAGMSARSALRMCADAAGKRVRWMVVQCVQGRDELEPWFAAHSFRVLRRLDVEERGKRYPTWLVEVPQ